MSEGEAYNRIEVARTARRFPSVLDMLADGRVHLTAVRLLAPHLTADNHADVLASARGKTKLEIQEIVARLAPDPTRPLRATRSARLQRPRFPSPPPSRPLRWRLLAGVPPLISALRASSRSPPLRRHRVLPHVTGARSAPSRRAGACRERHPLSPERYKLQVTISGETLEKMRAGQGHAQAMPSRPGDDAAILSRAFDALLEKLAKQKFAATDKPRVAPGTKIAGQDVTAQTSARSGCVTSGVAATSVRTAIAATSVVSSEFHHTDPRALGGEASVDLIELRCRRHNDYEGRLYFGSAAGCANSFRNESI
jgi:hypothetical protein